jgi:hypothetical protein
MKKIIILLSAVGSLCIHSCTKNNDKANMVTPVLQKVQPSPGGGEDIHRPIVIKVFDTQNVPISQANVLVIKGTDTLTGVTNASGNCTVYITTFGVWNVTVTHSGFNPLNVNEDLEDPMTEITEILQIQ